MKTEKYDSSMVWYKIAIDQWCSHQPIASYGLQGIISAIISRVYMNYIRSAISDGTRRDSKILIYEWRLEALTRPYPAFAGTLELALTLLSDNDMRPSSCITSTQSRGGWFIFIIKAAKDKNRL